jgi:hypothetical protein
MSKSKLVMTEVCPSLKPPPSNVILSTWLTAAPEYQDQHLMAIDGQTFLDISWNDGLLEL